MEILNIRCVVLHTCTGPIGFDEVAREDHESESVRVHEEEELPVHACHVGVDGDIGGAEDRPAGWMLHSVDSSHLDLMLVLLLTLLRREKGERGGRIGVPSCICRVPIGQDGTEPIKVVHV